jgi:hypothetical protein
VELIDAFMAAERQSGFFVSEQRRNILATATTTPCYHPDIPVQEVLMATMASTAKLLALHTVVASPLSIMWPTAQGINALQLTHYKRLA